MRCIKIWLVKIFIVCLISDLGIKAQNTEKRIIPARRNGVGFQVGMLSAIVNFTSEYMSYEGLSSYNLAGLWFKVRPLPAIFIAVDRNADVEGAQRFYFYVPLVIKRRLLIEGEVAYLKGFKMKDLLTDREIEFPNFKSARILGSATLFLNSNKFSWKHAFNFGERQIRSGGTWALGGDMGLYSLNTGRPIPLVLNDSSVVPFKEISILFLDGFFGGYYNWIVKVWQKMGKTRILGTGVSLLLGVSAQLGGVTIGNKEYPTGRVEMFGFASFSIHFLYTTDRWIFRIYALTRRHTLSPAKLLTINNRWSSGALQIIYLFGKT